MDQIHVIADPKPRDSDTAFGISNMLVNHDTTAVFDIFKLCSLIIFGLSNLENAFAIFGKAFFAR